MPLWPVFLLWGSIIGLAVVAICSLVVWWPEDDVVDDTHARAMRALEPERRR